MTIAEAIKAGHSATVVGKAIEIVSSDGKRMGRLWYPRPSAAQAGLRIAQLQAKKASAQ